MAGIKQNPGPADKYIFRYEYLLVEIGTDVMRKVFDFKVGSDFVHHLSANSNKFNTKLQSLIAAKIITADQAQYLPPIDMSPKSANYDITLLACLLRNVCGLRDHTDPMWKNPPPTDLSLEADLARLKECRNSLQHSGTVFISEADLTVKWNELSQILIRLNAVCGIPNLPSLINDAQSMDTDAELKRRLDQAEIKLGLSELKGLSKLKLSLSELKLDMFERRLGRSEIFRSLLENRSDMFEIDWVQIQSRGGLPVIRKDLSNVIRSQSESRGALSEIRGGLSEISGGHFECAGGMSEISLGQSEISWGQSELKLGLSEIKLLQSSLIFGQAEVEVGQSAIS